MGLSLVRSRPELRWLSRTGWILLVACASQSVPHEHTVVEPEPQETWQEVDAVTATVELLAPIPDPTAVEWPERFLGRSIPELVQERLLMALYRDDGHRAHELHLVPIDDQSGWVIDRGVVTSPDYSQALYERWSRVQLRGDELAIVSQVGRSEAAEAPHSEAHEHRYDLIAAHHQECVAPCDNRRCERRCMQSTEHELTTPHRYPLGDATVIVEAPNVRLEWDIVGQTIDDIDDMNVQDQPTRPVPFFVLAQRVQIDAEREAIVLSYGHGCDEDAFCPATRIFLRDNLTELEGEFRGYRAVDFPGDGTFRYTGGDSRNCEPTAQDVAAHRASVPPDEYDPSYYWWHQHREMRGGVRLRADGELEELPPRPQAWGPCTASFAAACPYVDVVTDDGVQRVGEILRWIRNEPATQGLALPILHGDTAIIRLSEEKPETTYLDSVWLELDGERVDPDVSLAMDGRYEVLRNGESLELQFPLRPHTQARLVAVGYYVVDH